MEYYYCVGGFGGGEGREVGHVRIGGSLYIYFFTFKEGGQNEMNTKGRVGFWAALDLLVC
jgi:hypothetical protein